MVPVDNAPILRALVDAARAELQQRGLDPQPEAFDPGRPLDRARAAAFGLVRVDPQVTGEAQRLLGELGATRLLELDQAGLEAFAAAAETRRCSLLGAGVKTSRP